MKDTRTAIGFTVPLKPGLWTLLREGARAKDVSLRTWIVAILIEWTGMHPGLTSEESDVIRRTVRGQKQ
jgi:hypothetical protein